MTRRIERGHLALALAGALFSVGGAYIVSQPLKETSQVYESVAQSVKSVANEEHVELDDLVALKNKVATERLDNDDLLPYIHSRLVTVQEQYPSVSNYEVRGELSTINQELHRGIEKKSSDLNGLLIVSLFGLGISGVVASPALRSIYERRRQRNT